MVNLKAVLNVPEFPSSSAHSSLIYLQTEENKPMSTVEGRSDVY